MPNTRHRVQLQYSKKEVRDLLNAAHRNHIDQGGRYTTKNSSIQIWPQTGSLDAVTKDSMGTFYFDWTTLRLGDIECIDAQALSEMLTELGTIEMLAWGKTKHGTVH